MRSPSSWVSRTRLASSSSAPFIHGGTAGRMSTSISIGTGSPWPGKAPFDLGVDRASPRPRRGGASAGARTARRARTTAARRRGRAGVPSAPIGIVDRAGREHGEHPAVGEGDVGLDVVGVPLVGDGLDADAGQAELDAVVPDPRVHRLAHLRIVRLLGEDVLELVAQPAREIDRHRVLPSVGTGWHDTHMSTELDQVDFFSDDAVVEDPYPYFEHLRSQCPVTPIAQHGVVAVTGWDEASEVYRDIDTFSSCNSVVGPFAVFPVPLEGDDVSDIIDGHRHQLPMHEHLVTMDPPEHTRERALLMRLITPKRLKQNEAFMWRLADQQLDEFVADGQLRVHQRVLAAVRDARGRRPARRARVRPRAVPGGLRLARQGAGHARRRGRRQAGAQRARLARRVVRRLRRGPPRESRAPTSSPTSRWRSTRTGRRPTSPRSCGSRRSCSPRGRRPRPASSRPR